MQTLTAATFLGENTGPILASIVERMRSSCVDIALAAEGGRSSPDALAQARDVDLVWMCGCLAVRMLDEGRLDHAVVAAPVFEGEADAIYRSVIVAHRDGPSTFTEALSGRVGVNEPESWSGHHGLRRHIETVARSAWFRAETVTGSHRNSVLAVAGRDVDAAAIDVTIWRYMVETEPDVCAALRVIDTTGDWPAPPFLVRDSLDRRLRVQVTESLLAATSDIAGLAGGVAASQHDYVAMRLV